MWDISQFYFPLSLLIYSDILMCPIYVGYLTVLFSSSSRTSHSLNLIFSCSFHTIFSPLPKIFTTPAYYFWVIYIFGPWTTTSHIYLGPTISLSSPSSVLRSLPVQKTSRGFTSNQRAERVESTRLSPLESLWLDATSVPRWYVKVHYIYRGRDSEGVGLLGQNKRLCINDLHKMVHDDRESY